MESYLSADPPENCHLNLKNGQKLAFFFKLPKIVIGNFVEKNDNFWQFF